MMQRDWMLTLTFCTIGVTAVTSACGSDGPGSGSGGQGGSGSAVGIGGRSSVGGTSSGGKTSTGGGSSSGGSSGGAASSGGGSEMGGTAGSSAQGDCSFSVVTNEISPQMATVGVIEWQLDGAPSEARIVYQLKEPSGDVLNRGGEAPVHLEREGYRTLLLGLKQQADYLFTIEATVEGESCVSETYDLPKTGVLSGAPTFSVSVDAPQAREPGFIVTATGYTGNQQNDATAFIIDADGDIVWAAPAPPDTARAKMDYEGETMWMLGLNFMGAFGEMRYLSMDGLTGQKNVEGLESAHHDFTVMPGGKVATMVWSEVSFDGPESEMLVRSPDGTIETLFRIGSNFYVPADGRFHANAVHYLEEEESFTLSDRYANLIVKVSTDGQLQWQLGGDCEGAAAGQDKCSAQSWNVNHGHHLLSDGSLVLFSNGVREGEYSYVVEVDVTETEDSMSAAIIKDYEGTAASGILGDVQRLPGGNTLITYSDAGKIVEVDPDWQVVQTFSGSVGYADWRPTLYGPPARL